MNELYFYEAEVIEVYDGDTITAIVKLGFDVRIKLKFRLYGIDTPEIRTKDKEEKERGIEARDYVRSAILNKTVQLKTYKQEKYGRYLCKVYVDNICLNDDLIVREMAKEYFGEKR